jgi:hypothetical protein
VGTNYYHRFNECSCCGRYDERHIGKSSAGWTFSFQAYQDVNSFDEWKERLKEGKIVDEYGVELTLEEFVEMVKSKQTNGKNHAITYPNDDNFVDKDGYSFSNRDFF